MGAESYLIDTADDINRQWLFGKSYIGISAGASAPEILVTNVINYLKQFGISTVDELDGVPENITFSVPKELRL